ncbi:hypothetical protein H0H92_002756 [Tricholoma furcatifolium]|nr:hypothetical protein H0H92_002756 [Tricholoma furcatifolium]
MYFVWSLEFMDEEVPEKGSASLKFIMCIKEAKNVTDSPDPIVGPMTTMVAPPWPDHPDGNRRQRQQRDRPPHMQR